MSGIQTFKYKHRKITVIFWNATVWFRGRELYDILGYKEGMSRFMTILSGDDMKFSESNVNLISELGLYTFTYHKGLKPKQREKAQALYDWFEEEVKPVFDEYIKSWLQLLTSEYPMLGNFSKGVEFDSFNLSYNFLKKESE